MKFVLIAAGLIVAAILAYLWVGRALLVPGRQVRNLADLQAWQGMARLVADETGEHPGSLPGLLAAWEARCACKASPRIRSMQDNWGHPVHYEAGSSGFILASFGRDGLPEFEDYWSFRELDSYDETPCSDADADTVISDRATHRACGK